MDERCEILAEHRNRLHEHIEKLQGFLGKLEQKVEFYRGYKARSAGEQIEGGPREVACFRKQVHL